VTETAWPLVPIGSTASTTSRCRSDATSGTSRRKTTTAASVPHVMASQYQYCHVPSAKSPPTLNWCGSAAQHRA
jgi:hypothetical protein